jgi:protein phosphatase
MQLSPSRLHHCGSLLAFGLTDVGQVRKANEDNFLIDEGIGMMAVGDGMGGHEAGEVASAAALEAVRDFIQQTLNQTHNANLNEDDTVPRFAPPSAILADIDPDATWADSSMPAVQTVFAAMDHANLTLFERNTQNLHADGRGMGTTLVGLWQYVPGAPIVVFNVGDSRLYLHRAGQLTQLTKDQTLYQQALDMGCSDNMPARNLLLQAIGPSDLITPQVFTHATRSGDVYLLCSDGLHGAMSDDDINQILAHANQDNLNQCCKELITLANANGGRDNITALLAWCA